MVPQFVGSVVVGDYLALGIRTGGQQNVCKRTHRGRTVAHHYDGVRLGDTSVSVAKNGTSHCYHIQIVFVRGRSSLEPLETLMNTNFGRKHRVDNKTFEISVDKRPFAVCPISLNCERLLQI